MLLPFLQQAGFCIEVNPYCLVSHAKTDWGTLDVIIDWRTMHFKKI
jgi:hypothetical protein